MLGKPSTTKLYLQLFLYFFVLRQGLINCPSWFYACCIAQIGLKLNILLASTTKIAVMRNLPNLAQVSSFEYYFSCWRWEIGVLSTLDTWWDYAEIHTDKVGSDLLEDRKSHHLFPLEPILIWAALTRVMSFVLRLFLVCWCFHLTTLMGTLNQCGWFLKNAI